MRKSVSRILYVLFCHLIRLISFLVPKDKTTWIFIGWRRSVEREIFAENSKYFFLHVHHNEPGIKAIWIGMDDKICQLLRASGYRAYRTNSLAGIYYALRAKYTIVSGLFQIKNWKYSGGSKLVQLWHGKSLKKTGHNSPYSLQRYDSFTNPNLFKPVYKFIAISEFLSDFIVTDFRIPKQDILVSGIPKQDALLQPPQGYEIDLDCELKTTLEKIRGQGARRIFFYGPTFRPDGSNPLEAVNLDQLNAKLKDINDYVVISLHPKFSVKQWFPNSEGLTNVFFCQGDYDRYPIMHLFDALITDYSSLTIDFLFMNKPTIYYAYDFKKYGEEMGVYDELWSLMPGPKVFTFENLLTAFDLDLTQFKDQIQEAKDKVFTFNDLHSSKRICDCLKGN